MKKLLALVLALVMTLGLATVGANAKNEYKDAADITYKEAVDVMSEIGVLGGDENGFRPNDELKRSEGAKIIAYLMLRNKAAEQLTGGTKFTDVPASHWAAGYIEYLAVEGIVGGIGDNKFDPDGPLSTAAFTKMLLGALGYDAVIEGLGGDDWMINVQKLAKRAGIFDGNEDNVVVSANVKRQEAALYAFNTVCTPLVEYENKGSSMTVNGATINFGASKATYRVNTAKDKVKRYDQINNTRTNDADNSRYVEFAEEYYEKLVRNGGGGKDNDWDDYGRPQNTWVYDGKKIGSYPVSSDLHYTSTVTMGQIYKDLGLTNDTWVSRGNVDAVDVDDDLCLFWIDGEATYNFDGLAVHPYKVIKESNVKIGGNGVDTYVYYDEGDVRIVCMSWFVGDVVGVYAATASREAYIDIAGRGGNDSNAPVPRSGKCTTEGYKVDDIVIYNAHRNDSGYGIDNVQKAEVVNGTLDNFVMRGIEGVNNASTGSVTISGKKYTYAAQVAKTPDGQFIKNNLKLDIVLDKYGYAIDVGDYGVQNYAVVVNTGVGGYFNNDKNVELLLTDGNTTGAVKLNSSNHYGVGLNNFYKDIDLDGDGNDDMVCEGDIVTYSISSNGSYVLTLKSPANAVVQTANDVTIIRNGSSEFNVGGTYGNLVNALQNNQSYRGNGKTVFLIKDNGGNFKAYEGIKNVPNVSVKKLVVGAGLGLFVFNSYAKDSSAATVVYVDLEGAGDFAGLKTNETVFVHYDKEHSRSVSNNGDTYYEVEAIVNGKKLENNELFKIDDTTYRNALKYIYGDLLGMADGTWDNVFDDDYYILYENYTTNSRGIASLDDIVDCKFGAFGLDRKSIGLGTGITEAVELAYIRSYNPVTRKGNAPFGYLTLATDYSVWRIDDHEEFRPSNPEGIPNMNKVTDLVYVWYTENTDHEVNYIFWTTNPTMLYLNGPEEELESFCFIDYEAQLKGKTDAEFTEVLTDAFAEYKAVNIVNTGTNWVTLPVGFEIPANNVLNVYSAAKAALVTSEATWDALGGTADDYDPYDFGAVLEHDASQAAVTWADWQSVDFATVIPDGKVRVAAGGSLGNYVADIEGTLVADKVMIGGYVYNEANAQIAAVDTLTITETGHVTNEGLLLSGTTQIAGNSLYMVGENAQAFLGNVTLSGDLVIQGGKVCFTGTITLADGSELYIQGGEIDVANSDIVVQAGGTLNIASSDSTVELNKVTFQTGSTYKATAPVHIVEIALEPNVTINGNGETYVDTVTPLKADGEEASVEADYDDDNKAPVVNGIKVTGQGNGISDLVTVKSKTELVKVAVSITGSSIPTIYAGTNASSDTSLSEARKALADLVFKAEVTAEVDTDTDTDSDTDLSVSATVTASLENTNEAYVTAGDAIVLNIKLTGTDSSKVTLSSVTLNNKGLSGATYDFGNKTGKIEVGSAENRQYIVVTN